MTNAFFFQQDEKKKCHWVTAYMVCNKQQQLGIYYNKIVDSYPCSFTHPCKQHSFSFLILTWITSCTYVKKQCGSYSTESWLIQLLFHLWQIWSIFSFSNIIYANSFPLLITILYHQVL